MVMSCVYWMWNIRSFVRKFVDGGGYDQWVFCFFGYDVNWLNVVEKLVRKISKSLWLRLWMLYLKKLKR